MQWSRCAQASSCPSGLAVCGGCPCRDEASRGALPLSGAPRTAAACSHGENGGKEGRGPLPSRRPSSGAGMGEQGRTGAGGGRGRELPSGG